MRVERLRNGIATLSLLAACFTSCTFLASAPLPTPPVPDSVAAVEVEAPAPLGPTALDLIVEQTGETLEAQTYADRDGAYQLEYAEALGLGSNAVELVRVG